MLHDVLTAFTPPIAFRLALGLCLVVACASNAQQGNDPAEALKAGRYAEAESLYRSQLRIHRSAEILTNLGITLDFEGRPLEAIPYFREAERLRPTAETYALLTQDLCRTGDLVSAGPRLDRIARRDQEDTKILAMVAPCFIDADRPADAVRVYQALSKTADYPPDLLLVQLARAYAGSAANFGKRLGVSAGSKVYLQALEGARTSTENGARDAFAYAAQHSHDFTASLSFLDAYEIWSKHPNDAALIYQMVVLSGEGVINSFQRCSDLYPNSIYLQEFKAEMLADQGREDEAITLLEELHRAEPTLAEARFRLGMLYRGHGDWEKAAEMFRLQTLSDPHDEAAAARWSESLIQLGKFAEIKVANEVRLQQPHPAMWTFLDMATAEQKLGNVSRAIEILKLAEKADRENRTVHYRLMRLYAQTGDMTSSNREKTLFESKTQ